MKHWYILILILSFIGCNSVNQGKKDNNWVEKLHESLLTIDSHADTPLNILWKGVDLSERSKPGSGGSKIDFPRMKEGGLDGAFFAVFVGQGPRTPEGNARAAQTAMIIFDSLHAMIKRYPELIESGLHPDDLARINREKKLAIYTGIENGYVIGNDISLLKTYFDLGARYITLCHSMNNDICDASTDDNGSEHGGLSEFGKKVVMEMNRLGIMIDVTHASDSAFYDILEITKAPVIASHSSARALCDHPRNLDDKMLLSLAANGGVIQVCAVGEYVKKMPPSPERDSASQVIKSKYGNYYKLSPAEQEAFLHEWFAIDSIFPPELATVSDFADHIDHVIKIAGIDHVGIGTDFDGGGELEGCYDASEMGNITAELLKRGYSRNDLQKIWSGNLMRVFREVEKRSLQIK